MKKGSKHTTEESHQTTKEKSKIGRKTQTNIKSEGMERDVPCKQKPKKSQDSLFISDKIDLKPKIVIKDKEGHNKMIKWPIQQEDIMFVNI